MAAGLRAEKLAEDLRKEGSPHAADAEELASYLRLLWADLRLLFLNLGKPHLENKTLNIALREYVEEIGQIARARLILMIDNTIDELPNIAEGFFLIARESISNSIQYAKPELVHVKVSRTDANFTLEVVDDGQGFDAQIHRAGYGIQYMTYIAKSLGGELSIKSEPGKGTIVMVSVPAT